jgi:hypothetical protein
LGNPRSLARGFGIEAKISYVWVSNHVAATRSKGDWAFPGGSAG